MSAEYAVNARNYKDLIAGDFLKTLAITFGTRLSDAKVLDDSKFTQGFKLLKTVYQVYVANYMEWLERISNYHERQKRGVPNINYLMNFPVMPPEFFAEYQRYAENGTDGSPLFKYFVDEGADGLCDFSIFIVDVMRRKASYLRNGQIPNINILEFKNAISSYLIKNEGVKIFLAQHRFLLPSEMGKLFYGTLGERLYGDDGEVDGNLKIKELHRAVYQTPMLTLFTPCFGYQGSKFTTSINQYVMMAQESYAGHFSSKEMSDEVSKPYLIENVKEYGNYIPYNAEVLYYEIMRGIRSKEEIAVVHERIKEYLVENKKDMFQNESAILSILEESTDETLKESYLLVSLRKSLKADREKIQQKAESIFYDKGKLFSVKMVEFESYLKNLIFFQYLDSNKVDSEFFTKGLTSILSEEIQYLLKYVGSNKNVS